MFEMLTHPDPEEQPQPQLIPPFSHFQGFSAPATSHRYLNNTCAACLSDERVSPRTVIHYHDHQTWESSRQRMEQLSDEKSRMPSTAYNSNQNHIGGLEHTHEYHQGLSGSGRIRQLSEPPTYTTPPPQYFSSPMNASPPAFAGRPTSVMSRPRVTSTNHPVPDQLHVPGRNTIRVPSNSDVSDADQQPQGLTTAGRRLMTNEKGELTPGSDDDDDVNSTVYPSDSITTASSSTASGIHQNGGAPPRSLEEAVVEVHNTCLAATQRYLESLRINWELRHGREILTPPGLAGPTRRLRDRAAARGSPYSYSLPRRRTGRALSDNSGLEHMRGLQGGGDGAGAGQEGVNRCCRQPPPACPIPAPTDSLLQNTSRICELIWRRAHRDREDVLGAEAGGARRMASLVGCAEAVVLYDAAEWDGDPERGFYTACRAGREFCRELGDSLGAERVDGIERGEV